VRDLPDVSLFAANGLWSHAYVFCYTDPGSGRGGVPCTGTPDTWNLAGGTSFSSPILAGVQALINQNMAARQGNPNPVYYKLAATAYGPTGSASCNSSNGNTVGSSCIFYDVTAGDIDANCFDYNGGTSGPFYNCYRPANTPSGKPGVLSTDNNSYQPAFKTTTGWDFATGIGTINVFNLVKGWKTYVTDNPPALQVTPANDIASSGNQGGPFSPNPFQYVLSASLNNVGFSISGVPSWLTASQTSGTVSTTGSAITFTVNSNANSLPAGTSTATIAFTDTTNNRIARTTTAALIVLNPAAVNGVLQVSPTTNIAAGGNIGGAFSPSSFPYQLSASKGNVGYAINGVPAWLTVSSASGTVATTPSTVTFTVNSNANNLAAGNYNATISFSDTTNGATIETITAALTVNTVVSSGNGTSKTYVSARTGTDAGDCPVTAPCASLNYALSVTSAGGELTILDGGTFGPVVLTQAVTINGSPSDHAQIIADPSAQVGCVSGTAGSCSANNGYAVEIAAGVADVVKLGNLVVQMGSSGGIGALKLTSGGQTEITNNVFRGDSAATTPIILMAPNTSGIQSEVYFSNSDIGFNNAGNANAGAVLVQPVGTNSLKLHFNHVEVHNASFGIRTDGSSLSSPSAVVASFISESEFFSFPNAAVNAFSTSGTGTVNAVFDFTRILNAGVALKANGAQSFVILTNNTVGGNTIGVQQQNGATVLTSHSSTITGNGPSNNQNVSGTVTQAPRQ